MREDLLLLLVPGVHRVPRDPDVAVRLGLDDSSDPECVVRGKGVGRGLCRTVHQEDALAVQHDLPRAEAADSAWEGLYVDQTGRHVLVEAPGWGGAQGSSSGGQAHSALRSSGGAACCSKAPDHGVDGERGQEAALLVVHLTLRPGHAVAGERRYVVVQHPPVGVDVCVKGQADGVDRGREGAVGLSLPYPSCGRRAAAMDMCPVNWASRPAWSEGSSGTSRNRTHASMTGGPTGASGSSV